MPEVLRLLWGTIQLRPYVFIFLVTYILAAAAQMGWRRTLTYLPLGYGIAWLSEFCSIHWGFPYGDYYYIANTMNQELWVGGVPFMDSLSYVFLSYCSYQTGLFLLSPVGFAGWRPFILETHALRTSWRTLVLGACFFVLLDIIIDPVALQGHRWFLGQIYGYRQVGFYFGIPMSNFVGWLVVGLALISMLQLLNRTPSLEDSRASLLRRVPGIETLGLVLYISVLVFNLAVTFWIGEYLLGLVGCLLAGYTALLVFFITLYKKDHLTREVIERHLASFPGSAAALLLSRLAAQGGTPGPGLPGAVAAKSGAPPGPVPDGVPLVEHGATSCETT